jgi:hypothetical protein
MIPQGSMMQMKKRGEEQKKSNYKIRLGNREASNQVIEINKEEFRTGGWREYY